MKTKLKKTKINNKIFQKHKTKTINDKSKNYLNQKDKNKFINRLNKTIKNTTNQKKKRALEKIKQNVKKATTKKDWIAIIRDLSYFGLPTGIILSLITGLAGLAFFPLFMLGGAGATIWSLSKK